MAKSKGKGRAQRTEPPTAGQGSSATTAPRAVRAKKNADNGITFVVIPPNRKLVDRRNRNHNRKNHSTGEVAAQPSAQPSGSHVSQELPVGPSGPVVTRPFFPEIPSQAPGVLPSKGYQVGSDWCLYPESDICILPPYLVLVDEGGVQRLRLRKRFSKCAMPLVEYYLNIVGDPYKMPFYLSSGMPRYKERAAAPFRYFESGDGAFLFRTTLGGVWHSVPDEVEALRRDPEGYHEDIDIEYPMLPMDSAPPAPFPAPENTWGSEGYESQVSHASSSANILTIDPALLSSERPKKRRRSSSPEPAKESGVPQQIRDVAAIDASVDSAGLLDFLPNVMSEADLGQSTGPSTLSESGTSGPPTPYFDHVLDTPSEDGRFIELPSDPEDESFD